MGCSRDEQRPPLFAEAEAGDYFAVPVDVAAVEVAELAPPLTNKLEETTTGVIVVLVRLEVRGEVLDALREDRHLDLRGAGIRRVDGEVPNQFGLALFRQQPSLRSSFAYRWTSVNLAQGMGNSNSEGPGVALILLSGLPGTGKTTFARALAERLEVVHVESDAIRRGLAAEPTYSPRESGLVFARVEAEARRALVEGRHALIDATNLTNRDRRRFVRLANETDAMLVAVRLTAPEEVVRERLAGPRDGHSQADLGVYEAMKSRPQPFAFPAIVVDTRWGLEPAIDLVVRMIHRGE